MLTRTVLPPNRPLRKALSRAALAASVIAFGYAILALLEPRQHMWACSFGVGGTEGVARLAVRKFLYEALSQWQVIHGIHCPNDLTELTPFMNSDDVKDPWGHPYVLICNTDRPSPGVVVVSAGADGEVGTEDDILSVTAWRR